MGVNDSGYSGQLVSAQNLDQTVLFRGNSLPATFPVGALFLNKSDNTIYENTGTEASPVWTKRSGGGEPDDVLVKLSNTISNYTTPTRALTDLTQVTDTFDSATGWTLTSPATISGGLFNSGTVTSTSAGLGVKTTGLLHQIFQIDFDLKILTVGGTNNDVLVLAVSNHNDIRGGGGTGDMIACAFRTAASYEISIWYKDNSSSTTASSRSSTGLSLNTWYYMRFTRSGTTVTFTAYSDSARTNVVATISLTVPSTVTGFDRIVLAAADGTPSNVNGSFQIDNLVYTTVTSVTQTTDNNLATYWQSSNQANPYLVFEFSETDVAALALALHTATTTITQFKIQKSSNGVNWADLRLLNVSDFTNDTWRFILLNLVSTALIRIYGSGTGILAVSEGKYRGGLTDTAILRNHYHRKLSSTSIESGIDSN
jgi:hypothetical protein